MRTAKDFIDKGLLTENEATILKTGDLSSTAWTAQWCVPLTWAIALVNNAFNNTGLVPKDHKDLISPICKFRNDLHLLAEYHAKPLPAVYKQAVWLAVWGWMAIGTWANQETEHKDYQDLGQFLTLLILNFPGHGILIYILVFGWLRVAEILNNPFGRNELYDINLATVLDLNIWKSSILLENQENFIDTSFAAYPAKKETENVHDSQMACDKETKQNDVSILV